MHFRLCFYYIASLFMQMRVKFKACLDFSAAKSGQMTFWLSIDTIPSKVTKYNCAI